MGTLKNIASLFVQTDEEMEAAKPAAAALPAATPVPAAQPTPAPLMTAGPSDPAGEAKISDRLAKAIEENNLDGIDFFEFRKTLDALVGVIADEPTRYRAAFGSLVAQGAKAENLMHTADHYIEVLNQKESGFAEHINGQRAERVQAKLAEADGIQKQIQDKSAAIARLTQEIGQLTQDEVAARNTAALAKAEIDAYQATFGGVKARFVSDIRSIQERINLYVLNQPKAQ